MEDKYVGTQIGIYKILEKSEKDSHGYTKYLVECEVCHQKLLKRIYEIKTHSKQCKHLDYFWEKGTPHRLKTIYKLMKKRCYNLKDKFYKFYGEKGIQICDEWLTNPQSFITWALENGYEENLSIDRKDSSKNYSPENCQWVLLEDNSRFKSNTNYFLFKWNSI